MHSAASRSQKACGTSRACSERFLSWPRTAMPAERSWGETNHAGDNWWTERCQYIILTVELTLHHFISKPLFVGKFFKLLARLCPWPVPVVQIVGSGAYFSLHRPYYLNRDLKIRRRRRQRKAIGLISKTTILHVHHAFLYISLPSLHDYDVKMSNLISQCTEEVHKRRRDFLSVSELGYGS